MSAGATEMLTLPTPTCVASAWSTKLRRRLEPYAWRFCGLVAKTPANWIVSPAFNASVLALLLIEMVEVDAQPVARPCVAPFTVTVVAPVAVPNVCEITFWSIFQFMPAESRPMRPLRYWSPSWSEGHEKALQRIDDDGSGERFHHHRAATVTRRTFRVQEGRGGEVGDEAGREACPARPRCWRSRSSPSAGRRGRSCCRSRRWLGLQARGR
jgi:hypothetical protein